MGAEISSLFLVPFGNIMAVALIGTAWHHLGTIPKESKKLFETLNVIAMIMLLIIAVISFLSAFTI